MLPTAGVLSSAKPNTSCLVAYFGSRRIVDRRPGAHDGGRGAP
jgi:hypothetical protein